MTNAEPTTVGAITNGSQSLGGNAPAISSAPENSLPENTEFGKRKVPFLKRKGCEAALDFADGRDRRILYDINNIKKIDKVKATGGDVPSTKNGRGSLTNSGFKESLSEKTESVNWEFLAYKAENLSELYRA